MPLRGESSGIKSKAVAPFSVRALGSAPASSRAFTTAGVSLSAAAPWRGVAPNVFCAFGSAPSDRQRPTSSDDASLKKLCEFHSVHSGLAMRRGWQAIAPRSRGAVSQGVNLLGSTTALIHMPDCEPTIQSIPSCTEVILRENCRSPAAFLKEEKLLRFILHPFHCALDSHCTILVGHPVVAIAPPLNPSRSLPTRTRTAENPSIHVSLPLGQDRPDASPRKTLVSSTVFCVTFYVSKRPSRNRTA